MKPQKDKRSAEPKAQRAPAAVAPDGGRATDLAPAHAQEAIAHLPATGAPLDLAQIVGWIRQFAQHVGDLDECSPEDFAAWLAARVPATRYNRCDVYSACLGRLPEAEVFAELQYAQAQDFANHVTACLCCLEFRQNLPRLVTQAFPRARRVFFVHVPKTGGTGVRDRLSRAGKPVWDWSFALAHVVARQPKGHMLSYLASTATASELFFTGHMPLGVLLGTGLLRSRDMVFSVLRDPEQSLLSAINYMFMRAEKAWNEEERAKFAALLQSLKLLDLADGAQFSAALGTLLRSDLFRFEAADMLQRYLGDGSVQPLQTVLGNVICSQLLLVPLGRLDRFMEQLLGMDVPDYDSNVSERRVDGLDRLTLQDRAYAYEQLLARDITLQRLLFQQLPGQFYDGQPLESTDK